MKTLLLVIMLMSPISLQFENRISWNGNYIKYKISSKDDIICTAFVINDEARGEGNEGMRAVLDVVLTRMTLHHMSACEVVKQKKQFSGYKPGSKLKVSNKALTQYEFVSNMKPVVEDAEFFHSVDVRPKWARSFEKIRQISRHIFYRRHTCQKLNADLKN